MSKEATSEVISFVGDHELLTIKQAVEWLKTVGIPSSRSTLERTRNCGRLPYLKVRGRARYLYRRKDLIEAVVVEVGHAQHEDRNPAKRKRINPEMSNQRMFEKARELARRKPSL